MSRFRELTPHAALKIAVLTGIAFLAIALCPADPASGSDPVPVLDSNAMVEKIAGLEYGQPPGFGDRYAAAALVGDPALTSVYIDAIAAPKVGMDVKRDLAGALREVNPETLPSSLLALLQKPEEIDVPGLETLVRLAIARPSGNFLTPLTCLAVRSFGSDLPQDPDIFGPVFSWWKDQPSADVRASLRTCLETYALKMALASFSEKEMAEPEGNAQTNLPITDEFTQICRRDVNVYLDFAFAHMEGLQERLTDHTYSYFLGQILTRLKLSYAELLLRQTRGETQLRILQSLYRFLASSESLLQTVKSIAESGGENAEAAKAYLDSRLSRPIGESPSDDLFNLKSIEKTFPGPNLIDMDSVPDDTGANLTPAKAKRAKWPWVILLVLAIVIASRLRRLHFVRRKVLAFIRKWWAVVATIPAAGLIAYFTIIHFHTKTLEKLSSYGASEGKVLVSPARFFHRVQYHKRNFLFQNGSAISRSIEVPLGKPPWEIRVVGIGASPILGSDYPREETFMDLAVGKLQAEMPDRQFRSLNCAVAGISIFDHLLQIDDVLDAEPDAVVFYLGENPILRIMDMLNSRMLLTSTVRVDIPGRTGLRLSQFFNDLQVFAKRIEARGGYPSGQGPPALSDEERWRSEEFANKLFRISLEESINRLREKKIPAVIMLAATPNPDFAHETLNKIQASVGMALRVRVVNTPKYLSDIDKTQTAHWRQFFWDETHPTGLGHKYIAEALHPDLKKSMFDR